MKIKFFLDSLLLRYLPAIATDLVGLVHTMHLDGKRVFALYGELLLLKYDKKTA